MNGKLPPNARAVGVMSDGRAERSHLALPDRSAHDDEAQVARHTARTSAPGSPPRELAPNHQTPKATDTKSDCFTKPRPHTSDLQRCLLALADEADGGIVTFATALERVYGLERRVNSRGKLAFNRNEAAAPRTALTTSVRRLARRGLVQIHRHGFSHRIDASACSITDKHSDSHIENFE